MAAETVTVERHGPVLRVRMNRPDKLNAQHPTLITELDAAFAAGAADADVRVIVLSGQGRAFSAGHDLEYPGYDQRLYTDQSRLDMERSLFVDNLLDGPVVDIARERPWNHVGEHRPLVGVAGI